MTRDEAQSECESRNLTLAMPKTEQEFAALGTYLGSRTVTGSQPGGYMQVWVGLERQGDEWKWLDEICSVSHVEWSPREPSGDGVCATMRKDSGTLNDLNCNRWKMSSVCEPISKYPSSVISHPGDINLSRVLMYSPLTKSLI